MSASHAVQEKKWSGSPGKAMKFKYVCNILQEPHYTPSLACKAKNKEQPAMGHHSNFIRSSSACLLVYKYELHEWSVKIVAQMLKFCADSMANIKVCKKYEHLGKFDLHLHHKQPCINHMSFLPRGQCMCLSISSSLAHDNCSTSPQGLQQRYQRKYLWYLMMHRNQSQFLCLGTTCTNNSMNGGGSLEHDAKYKHKGNWGASTKKTKFSLLLSLLFFSSCQRDVQELKFQGTKH